MIATRHHPTVTFTNATAALLTGDAGPLLDATVGYVSEQKPNYLPVPYYAVCHATAGPVRSRQPSPLPSEKDSCCLFAGRCSAAAATVHLVHDARASSSGVGIRHVFPRADPVERRGHCKCADIVVTTTCGLIVVRRCKAFVFVFLRPQQTSGRPSRGPPAA